MREGCGKTFAELPVTVQGLAMQVIVLSLESRYPQCLESCIPKEVCPFTGISVFSMGNSIS